MRTRITVAIVVILVGALTVAGLISLFLERSAANRDAESTVYRQTLALVSALKSKPALAELFATPTGARDFLALIDTIAGTRAAVLGIGANGKVSTDLLPDIPVQAIDGARLAQGKPDSGVVGGTAFAAVPLLSSSSSGSAASSGGGSLTVAYALERPVGFSADSALYFVLAGGIALVVAGVAASLIARRISRRVVAASNTATRIARGDLDARVVLLRHDYPELEGLGTSLNTMAAALARARHLEREFLLSVSHDLRTPLTSIRGYAEAIADQAAPDPARAAEIVVAEARRLERLIGDLLDLARLDAHQFSLRLVVVDAVSCVTDSAEALRYEFEACGIALLVVTPTSEMLVSVDPDRLAQVVSNLLENALKFATSEVRVSIGSDGHAAVRVTVEDDGPGIDDEDLPHIFERLFTSNRRAARAAGTGLGLAIVAELTAAMSGSVLLRSPADSVSGTAIDVVLPRQPSST